jgi:hypothetical protein
MMSHFYLKNGVVYIPTVVQLTTGAYLDVDPVAVEQSDNTEGLRRAISAAITRGNAVVSTAKGKWPAPVLLKYAGARSWSAFARGASMWSIDEEKETNRITGYRDHADGYWVPDPDKTINFPGDSKIEFVVSRMIEILQAAAAK